MCGICGVAYFESGDRISGNLVEAMAASLAHRGPDAGGLFLENNVGIGFRRLSIIDLSEYGNQPFSNESQSIHLICNGEIYNHDALRSELIRAGHTFVSRNDCETVLHAYEQYGLEFIHKLEGMFAFAVYDAGNQQLILARDRLGIKPLYYQIDERGLRFASELKAILVDRNVPQEIDARAVNLYFVRGVIPAPFTIYRGIEKLLPGEMMTVHLRQGPIGVNKKRYWSVLFEPSLDRSETEIAEELRWRIKRSVQFHMVSDVPVGILLSGGMDSSTVLANMRGCSTAALKGFTVGFTDSENDESEIARRLAELWDVDHYQRSLPPDRISGMLGKLVSVFDEPFGDTSSIPSLLLSELASQHVKVVLSGDGGDELFSGYLSSQGARNLEAAGCVPQPLRKTVAHLLSRFHPAASLKRLGLPTWLMMASLRDDLFDQTVRNIVRPEWRSTLDELLSTYDHLRSRLESLPPINACFAGLLAQYLPDDILTKVDRVSSAHGLETRVPLLDHHLVSLAASVPPGMRFKKNTPKYIFRKAVRNDVPKFVMDHPKRGFGFPASYFAIETWHKELDILRRQAPQFEDIVDFSDRQSWGGQLTWRALIFGTWMAHRGSSRAAEFGV
jgi:asparagine synthase (glutamine-hydrolysing)